MLRTIALAVRLALLRVSLTLHAVVLHVLTVCGTEVAAEEVLRELVSCARRAVFEALAERASVWVCHCDEEVGRGLSVRGLVSHVDEVLPSVFGGPEVRHLALVEHANLIEKLVQRLACLVNSNDGCHMSNVGGQPEGADEFKCCRRATSGVSVYIRGQGWLRTQVHGWNWKYLLQ